MYRKLYSARNPRLSACPLPQVPNLDADFQTKIWDISRTSTRWDAGEERISTSVHTRLHLSARCTCHARALPPEIPSPTPLPLRYGRRPMGLPAGGRSLTVPQTLVCAAERGINTFSVCAAPAPLGASGFGPNPVPRAPHHHITTTLHHRRASPPSPPSTSPPPRALPPLSFLLHSPHHGSTSPEGPWSAACKSPRQTGQPDARTREPYRGRVSGSRAPQWPRVGLGSPLRKIAGRALALAPVAGGVPNTPYPYCVHVCPSVSVCVWCRATCGGQKSTCSACVPAVGVCVSRGAM